LGHFLTNASGHLARQDFDGDKQENGLNGKDQNKLSAKFYKFEGGHREKDPIKP
jgi:hypothetical protein